MPQAFTIRAAHGPADMEAIAGLLREYWASLPFDSEFQNFGAELASLPGKYVPPGGALLLAETPAGKVLGCIAMRPLSQELVEMKRLYVAHAARGLGLGRALAEAIIAEARRVGYREMKLDTIPILTAARTLYESMGFVAVAPYYENPPEGVLYFGKDLTAGT